MTGFNKYKQSYNHDSKQDAEYSITRKSDSCPFVVFPLPQPPGPGDHWFSVTVILEIEILLSLSMMHMRFITALLCVSSLFHLTDEEHFIVGDGIGFCDFFFLNITICLSIWQLLDIQIISSFYYCEQSCYEHLNRSLWVDKCFHISCKNI